MSALADIRVPQITREDLSAFHESHFSQTSIANFGAKINGFSKSVNEQTRGSVAVDNGLDGENAECKLQHKEGVDLELSVEAETEAEADGNDKTYDDDNNHGYDYDAPFDPSVAHLIISANFEEGEVVEEANEEEAKKAEEGQQKLQRKKRRKKKNNNSGNGATKSGNPNSGVRRVEVKPDLRKRTWDVVDKGLGSLDYDGAETNSRSMPASAQRRRVQYGDD